MRVPLGPVLHPDEKRQAANLRGPRQMVALRIRDSKFNTTGLKVSAQFTAQRAMQLLLHGSPRARHMKCRGPVALPVINTLAAHGACGLRRHHAATMLPIRFCITPLKTAGTAARGCVGKFFFASIAAIPPFCIPTSIAIVRAVITG